MRAAVEAHFIAVAAHAADKHGIIADVDLADALERLGQRVRRETKLLLEMRQRGRGRDIHTSKQPNVEHDQQQRDQIINAVNELYMSKLILLSVGALATAVEKSEAQLERLQSEASELEFTAAAKSDEFLD